MEHCEVTEFGDIGFECTLIISNMYAKIVSSQDVSDHRRNVQ